MVVPVLVDVPVVVSVRKISVNGCPDELRFRRRGGFGFRFHGRGFFRNHRFGGAHLRRLAFYAVDEFTDTADVLRSRGAADHVKRRLKDFQSLVGTSEGCQCLCLTDVSVYVQRIHRQHLVELDYCPFIVRVVQKFLRQGNKPGGAVGVVYRGYGRGCGAAGDYHRSGNDDKRLFGEPPGRFFIMIFHTITFLSRFSTNHFVGIP